MSDRLARSLAVLFAVDEGLYSNDPDDIGGETVYGIARKFHPRWAGWPRVDAARRAPGFPLSLADDDELMRLAAYLLDSLFWSPGRCEELPDPVGEKLFEAAVNVGVVDAVKLLQIALNGDDRPVKVDGVIGPKTLAAVASHDPQALYDSMQIAQGGFYLGRRRPKYLAGWLARAFRENDGGATWAEV